MEVQEFI